MVASRNQEPLMVRLAELEKSSRLQRLLWTEEYVCLKDENVVIESSFVLEDSEGRPLKMVCGGLTPHVLVLAEYLGRCKTEREEIFIARDTATGFDFINIEHEGLDNMELLWLLPLENIHLTVSKRATRHGLRVLRLRFCSGQLFHLELAEGSNSHKMWNAWIHCIVELNRYRHKVLRGLVVAGSHHSSLTENQSNNKSNIPDWWANDSHGVGSGQSPNGRVPVKKSGKDSLTDHLVSHFKEQMKHSQTADTSHHRSIALQQDHPFKERSASHQHSITSSRKATGVSSSSSTSTTTESAGSAFSATSVRRLLRHLDLETAFRMCLFIGDYFGQFLFEVGMNGLPQRMASMSAMGHFLEADDCNMDSDDVHFGFGIEKDALRRCASLPSQLEGEASFVEDLKQVDDVTHKTSLVYLDLANEDGAKQAHVINGHVMLITAEEFQLHGEVKKHREQPMDLRFATARHPDVIRKRTIAAEKLHVRRGAILGITDKIRTGIHHLTHKSENGALTIHSNNSSKDDHKLKSSKQKRGNTLKTFMKRMKKSGKASSQSCFISTVPVSVSHHYEYVYEIEIDDVARELTAIDGELFLRVHEAELIDCMWLRDDKHHRSPNVLACIEFFHRVFGIVVTEILLPIEPRERADLMARFTRIANQCFTMKNFHSTKAIMSAFQSPAIQRLRDTWGCFERIYPESYSLWQDIYRVISDEGSYQTCVNHLKEAMASPPCLPFLGPFLKQITEYYMGLLIPEGVYHPANHESIQADETTSEAVTQDSKTSPNMTESATDSAEMSRSSMLKASKSKASKSSMAAILSRIGLSTGKAQSHTSELSSKTAFVDARSSLTSHSNDHSSLSKTSQPNSSQPSSSSCDVTSNPSSEIYLQTVKQGMSIDRKRHIQSLIIDYAKRLCENRGLVWNPKQKSTATNAWDFVLEEAFDFESLFKRVKEAKEDHGQDAAHKFSELALLVQEEKTHGYCLEGISSELDITSTLFHFQLAVVQYRIQSNESVRDFLMKAHYNSDVENFMLSLRREPSER